MEVSLRSLRVFSRHFKKTYGFINFRTATTIPSSALREEQNSDLLNKFNQDIKAGGVVPVFRRALLFPSRIALQDEVGIYTYGALHEAASKLSREIAAQLFGDTELTIAYMCRNDASHVIVQWAIWMTGNIAVPLSPLHPPDMQKYFIGDSTTKLVVCTQEYEQLLKPITSVLTVPLLVTGHDQEITSHDQETTSRNQPNVDQKAQDPIGDMGKSNLWYGDAEAMIIYTSGTTSMPKGVVWTHTMLNTQIASLHTAWQYSANDVVLHALPLHHIHGQLNSLNASLASGARIRMLPSFVSHTVWSRLLCMAEREEGKVTVFHGVPAMYAKLAADHEKMFGDAKSAEYVRAALSSRMRLMCAGSAPLPESLFLKWEKISGIRLLERYGMSEVGMALSNPYRPVEDRSVGAVGVPLPGIAARVAAHVDGDAANLTPLVTVVTPSPDLTISLDHQEMSTTKDPPKEFIGLNPKIEIHTQSKEGVYEGELLIKGRGVFTRYWNRAPKINSSDFTEDGWFRTGDMVSYSDKKFKILGRNSMDIIKSGGYKVSALQVESVLLDNPKISDAAVIGIEDETYGEIVTAVVVLKTDTKLSLEDMKTEAGRKLAPYQVPKTMMVVEEMPRNHMGKLDKKQIKKLILEKTQEKK